MFDWISDLISGIGNAISSVLSGVWETVSGSIWGVFMNWRYTYTTLTKATIAEAIGFDGSDDEKELLKRQVNGLNEKMIAIVNESIASGEDIESREAEIKEIADTIEDLKRRIQIITENSMKNAEYADRIAEIERIITERASHQNEYDTASSVRWWNALRCTPTSTSRSSSAADMRWKKRWNNPHSPDSENKALHYLCFYAILNI